MDLYSRLLELLGPNKTEELLSLLRQGGPIIVSGPQRSGKTTLARTLREYGFSAFEDWECHNFIVKDQSGESERRS